MTIKEQIDQDLKTAMLSGDKTMATTLRGIKAVILSLEIAEGKRDTGLPDEAVISALTKEAKKRQESADMYRQGGNSEKAEAELTEKKVIERYLPEQLSEDELVKLVDEVIVDSGASGMQDMGKVIAAVKQKTGGKADGAAIAQQVRQRLEQ